MKKVAFWLVLLKINWQQKATIKTIVFNALTNNH